MEDGVSVIFNIPFFNIPVTNVVVMSWIVMAIVIIFSFVATRKFSLVPTGVQNVVEIIVEAISNFVTGILGENGKKYVPYLGTVAIFLAIANTMGALFMAALTGGVVAPITRTLAVPVALALMTILIVIGSGIRKKGVIGFIKGLFQPVFFMFPLNILEFFIKPLSLSMRLYGNIFGAYVIMEMIIHGIPLIFPSVVCLYFDLFDGLLQAFVFILLSTLYIGEEVAEEEE